MIGQREDSPINKGRLPSVSNLSRCVRIAADDKRGLRSLWTTAMSSMIEFFERGDYKTGFFACHKDILRSLFAWFCTPLATGCLVGEMNDEEFNVPVRCWQLLCVTPWDSPAAAFPLERIGHGG